MILSAKTAVRESISEAQRVFFVHRTQMFKGNLNPLSGRNVFYIPIVMVSDDNGYHRPTEEFAKGVWQKNSKYNIVSYHSALSCMIVTY